MLYIELCEVELELLADRHVNIGTIGLVFRQKIRISWLNNNNAISINAFK